MALNRNGLDRAIRFALQLPLAVAVMLAPAHVAAAFAQIEPADTTNGYLARLLNRPTSGLKRTRDGALRIQLAAFTPPISAPAPRKKS